MNIITPNIAKLIFFSFEFIALLFLWNFLRIAIKQQQKDNVVKDVLNGKYSENDSELHVLSSIKLTSATSVESEEDQTLQRIEDALKQIENEQKEENNDNEDDEDNHNEDNEEKESDLQIISVSDVDPEETFQITQPLGEGAYGPVFLAVDRRDNEKVALKVMSFDENNPDKDLVSEIQILRRCHSPFIVNFKDTFFKEDNIWLAMEFCDGGSILDVMQITKQNLTEIQCACVLHQSIQGLMYLHSMNLIHRDIKAANILINSKGFCKLADFGVAKSMRASGVGTTIGSPYWMAPEVFGQANYGISADIWSLGIVAIEMIMGHPPLSNIKPMQAMFMIPKNPPPQIPEDFVEKHHISQGLIRFIDKCLKKNPSKRSKAKQLFEDEWIQEVAHDNRTELVPWISKAMPLLQKERELAAFMANQDRESSESEQAHGQSDSMTIEMQAVREHRPTGTFVLSVADVPMHEVSGTAILNLTDIPSQEEVEETQITIMSNNNANEKEESYENTEIRHENASSSSDSDGSD